MKFFYFSWLWSAVTQLITQARHILFKLVRPNPPTLNQSWCGAGVNIVNLVTEIGLHRVDQVLLINQITNTSSFLYSAIVPLRARFAVSLFMSAGWKRSQMSLWRGWGGISCFLFCSSIHVRPKRRRLGYNKIVRSFNLILIELHRDLSFKRSRSNCNNKIYILNYKWSSVNFDIKSST